MSAGRPSPEEIVASLTGSETPTAAEVQDANRIARERNANRARTRLFRGVVDGHDVLVTLHDPEGYGEIAFRVDGRWGVPSELFEVE